MADFLQQGSITTIHDLGTGDGDQLEAVLEQVTRNYRIGLVLPITASDMRAPAFGQIVERLQGVRFLDTIAVVLNRTDGDDDYRKCAELIAPLGDLAHVLWTDGPRVAALNNLLIDAGFPCDTPGKGHAVWTAFGYLLADSQLKAYVLHDCDIVGYRRSMLMRLCLPIAHPSLDFDFCKAYYARCTDRMYGRLVRLLITPLLSAMLTVFGQDDFLTFLSSFRYPLAGEFGVTAALARSNRTPCDWGLEVGTLAEVFRNTSPKRVCQVDLAWPYEHKHQTLDADKPETGLMKMASDVLMRIYRTLASRGRVFQPGHFVSLRAAYLRSAQDAIRKYHTDALINGLEYDRHVEEQAVESLAQQVWSTGQQFLEGPSLRPYMPTWTRVLAALPEFPQQLRDAAAADAKEHGGDR